MRCVGRREYSGGDLDATADLNGYLASGANEANISID